MSLSESPIPDSPEKKEGGGVQSVDRALLLLKLVCEHSGPVSIGELCASTGLNRTTVWRLLSTLEKNHFIDRDPGTKDYDLGIAATTLCVEPQRRYAPLIRCAMPEMRPLMAQAQESVLLSVPHPAGTLVISQINPSQSIRLRDYDNLVTPLQNTSNGKVMLAGFSPVQLEQYLSSQPAAGGADGPWDPQAFRREIEETARRGYGIVVGEFDRQENGISAPIRYGGSIIGFLGLGGPCSRFTRERMERISAPLLAACRRIERQLAKIAD